MGETVPTRYPSTLACWCPRRPIQEFLATGIRPCEASHLIVSPRWLTAVKSIHRSKVAPRVRIPFGDQVERKCEAMIWLMSDPTFQRVEPLLDKRRDTAFSTVSIPDFDSSNLFAFCVIEEHPGLDCLRNHMGSQVLPLRIRGLIRIQSQMVSHSIIPRGGTLRLEQVPNASCERIGNLTRLGGQLG